MRRNPALEALFEVAEQVGATVEVDRRPGHIQAFVTFGGVTKKLSISGTPSARNTGVVTRQYARRTLRAMGAAI